MGGVDKLDMVCSLYKQTVRSRRWYIYIWLDTIIISVANAWILYRRNTGVLDPRKRTMPLRVFQGMLADSLVKAQKRGCGRPTAGSLSPMVCKKKKVQGLPTADIRRYCIDHFPAWEEARQRCMNCNLLTYIKCTKCKVWLCLNKDRNCYNEFHGR